MRRVDRQRREHREDPVLEQLLAVLLLVAVEVAPSGPARCRPRQLRDEVVAEQPRVPLAQVARTASQIASSTSRGISAGRRADGEPGGDPALEAGHPDHEELVEVAGEDRREPDPLEQRQLLVLGQLEHPLVEPQPGQLAVEEPVLELLDRGQRLVGHGVRRLDVEGLLGDVGATGGDVGVGAVEGHAASLAPLGERRCPRIRTGGCRRSGARTGTSCRRRRSGGSSSGRRKRRPTAGRRRRRSRRRSPRRTAAEAAPTCRSTVGARPKRCRCTLWSAKVCRCQ